MRLRRCAAALPVCLLAASAGAGERLSPDAGIARDELFEKFELRLGAFAHDRVSPERSSADVNGEILFAPFARKSSGAGNWLTPRIHVGATLSMAGKTSVAYAGLTWTFDVTRTLFIEGAIGGALHNGKTGAVPRAGHNAMGCGAAFHEAASLGYRLTRAFSLMATVEHTSNAGLCAQNRGLTNFGLRAGYRF